MRNSVTRVMARRCKGSRKLMLKAPIVCESLEGRRLLSADFGGMAQHTGMAAEVGGFGGGGQSLPSGGQSGSFGGFASNQSQNGGQGFSGRDRFGNGMTDGGNFMRPYVRWQNSAQGDSGATTGQSSVQSTNATPSSQSSNSSNTTSPSDSNFQNGNGGPGGNGAGGFGAGQSFPDFLGGTGSPGNQGTTSSPGNQGFGMGSMGFPGGGPSSGSNGHFPGSMGQGMSQNSDVSKAMDTLTTELKNDIPSGAKPTFASLGTLMDDLDAIRNGTLTGSDAQAKVKADEAAVLTALGVTADQITTIQADEDALVAAINASTTSSDSSSTSGSSTNSQGKDQINPMTEVPLLSFLSQLRQNRPSNSSSSGSTTTSNSTTTSTTSS